MNEEWKLEAEPSAWVGQFPPHMTSLPNPKAQNPSIAYTLTTEKQAI